MTSILVVSLSCLIAIDITDLIIKMTLADISQQFVVVSQFIIVCMWLSLAVFVGSYAFQPGPTWILKAETLYLFIRAYKAKREAKIVIRVRMEIEASKNEENQQKNN